MGTTSQRPALLRNRKRASERGKVRFEVLGLDADRELIRGLARRLASNDPYSNQIRRVVREALLGEHSQRSGILNALRRSPLVGADLNVTRQRS